MSSPDEAELVLPREGPGRGATVLLAASFALGACLFLATASWNRWHPSLLIPIAVLAVLSELTSVDVETKKVRCQGRCWR